MAGNRGFWAVILLAAAIQGLGGCTGGREKDWRETWGQWNGKPLPYGPGAVFVVAEHRREGESLETRRFRYLLKEIRKSDGLFGCTFDDGEVRQVTRRLHPSIPTVLYGTGSPGRRPIFPLPGALVKTTVPAGTFKCARTTRSRELGDGTIMRVDEWWAPQIPFAIQRWERPEAEADKELYAPPTSPEALPPQCVWAVLERMGPR